MGRVLLFQPARPRYHYLGHTSWTGMYQLYCTVGMCISRHRKPTAHVCWTSQSRQPTANRGESKCNDIPFYLPLLLPPHSRMQAVLLSQLHKHGNHWMCGRDVLPLFACMSLPLARHDPKSPISEGRREGGGGFQIPASVSIIIFIIHRHRLEWRWFRRILGDHQSHNAHRPLRISMSPIPF